MDETEKDLIKCCANLESTKVRLRKQGCNDLNELLRRREVINYLNESATNWWTRLYNAIIECMNNDHDKNVGDCRKKGAAGCDKRPESADVFSYFIRIAVREEAINFINVVQFMLGWLKDQSKSTFQNTFLKILSECVLTNSRIRNSLKESDWETLFLLLKAICRSTTVPDPEIIRCLALVIKVGPLHKFPVFLLREQFSFVRELCQTVTTGSPKPAQEALVELLFEFCKHTAKDNRSACCKLGEDTFANLVCLYRENDDGFKANLIQFFLFQVALHNPKGVKKGAPAAYALSWDFWLSCLSHIYDMLIDEIDRNLHLTVKNQALFICNNGVDQLFDDFVRLFVEVCRQLFSCHDNASDEPPPKRIKIEMTVANLIDKIQTTKSWTWINLTYPLIETYPDMINSDDYSSLLKILTSFQSEAKESTLLFQVNKTLIALLKIEMVVSPDLWRNVADSTLRLINQNDSHVHTILQLLIKNKHITSPDSLFQYYRAGGALNTDDYNLETIDVAFKTLTTMQFDRNTKLEVIKWILNSNLKWSHQKATILFCLVLKQWPNFSKTVTEVRRPFEDFEDSYLSVCFGNLLVNFEEGDRGETEDVFSADQGMLDFLIEALAELLNETKSRINDIFDVVLLIFKVLSYLYKFDLVKTPVEDLELYKKFRERTRDLFDNISFNIDSFDERTSTRLCRFAQSLCFLFRTEESEDLSKKVRELVPERIIKDMFEILSTDYEEAVPTSLLTLKKNIIEILVTFSCLPKTNSLPIQERALGALLRFDYDHTSDSDYELVSKLLRSVISCNLKSLPSKSLLLIFQIYQKTCEVRYYCYVSAVEILDLFYDFYPIVASSSNDCKSQFVQILYPFYDQRLSYGPGVSVSLLKCMELLFELDLNGTYAKWNNDEIIMKVPEFLTSDYQEVRFASIKVLAKFFKISSQERLLGQYHRQEIMFSKICEMSLRVLQVEGAVSEDRIVDETVSRSSSIFHTFASIMIASNLWIEEALFALFKMVCDKNLNLSQLETVIDMVAAKLGFKSGQKLLEKYLVGLVNRWKIFPFEKFPLRIFKADSKIKFFAKYWNLLAHIFVESEKNSLNQIAQVLGKSLQKLIEDSCSRLLSHCIGQEVTDLTSIAQNQIYQLLRDTLGLSKAQEIFKNNVEEIILCLIEFVCDENDFGKVFGEFMIFPKVTETRLSVSQFHDSLQFIENSLYNDASVFSLLMRNNPEKIYFILLQLNRRINDVQAVEDKLRYFHLYSIIASLCLDNVMEVPSMQTYLIRDLTHTLLHNIKSHKKQLELSKMSCKFFKTCLRKILPGLAKIVTEFFLVIISRLKYVALEKCAVSDACVDMLELLIVEHRNLFVSEIEKLDSVPQTPQFKNIFSVHFEIKYSDRKVTLEDEIVQFLDFSRNIESLDECEHSVTHLKTLLTTKKDELEKMYSNLRQTRGFSEDCENSSLHKLICVLITLSCSPNLKMSTEAARCLGEIGPADLATLILQPEKAIPDSKWTPWELVLGCAVSLLSKYLVDADVAVVNVASVALFQILATREGRKVAKSETDFGFGAINCGYLTPFCAIEMRTGSFSVRVKGDFFVDVIQDDNLWIPAHGCHKTWVTKLVCTLLDTFEEESFFSSIVDVCRLKTEFCEQILPLIIYTVLYLNTAPLTNVIATQIETFFEKHWDITVKKQNCAGITTNRSSVQCMLNVVHFVRLQRSARKKEIRDMKLDYLRVAKAAHFCTAHFTALLYAELWCQEQINHSPKDYAVSTCSYTKLDLIYEKCDEITGNALQGIFRQAYKSVGESDALLGCGTFHLLNPATRVDHYKELGRWDQVTRHYEMEVSLGRTLSVPPLVDSLKSANLYQLSLFCSGAFEEPNYESLWRLGHWSYTRSDLSHNTYDKCKFYALKALQEKDELVFKKSMDEARLCVVEEFMGANMESIKNFYNSFVRLQSLKEVEEFSEALGSGEVVELLVKWKNQDDIVCNDFQYVEPVQAQRISLLGKVMKFEGRRDATDVVLDAIISYAQCARIEGNSNVAFRILENLRLLPSSNDTTAKIQLEEAQLCWKIQDDVTAKCILRQLCTNENVNPRLHAMALKMTGEWMVESSSENRQTIIDNYFEKSLNIIRKNQHKSQEDERCILDTYEQLAKFADHEYQAVMSHINSDIFQKKKQNMVKAKQAVSRVSLDKATRDLQKAVTLKKKFSVIDEAEIQNIETEKNNLLTLSLKYYLLNLIKSDNHNMTIFRLFSLLLENRNERVVKTVLEKELLKIPTYKFINILPQIIPHICSAASDLFSQTVNNVIEKCAKDHPYHTLPLILSLALSNKDRDYAESKAVEKDGRSQSAKAILTCLKKDKKLANLISKMESVSEAVIELAYYHNETGDGRSLKVPKRLKIRKIQNFDEVLLPTYTLPVNKSCDYEKIVGIGHFSDVYYNVGGINAPKRITCQGTDGITRSQLIKGQDDIRQDAVMQQVFTIMNNLLSINKQTKNLRIRTYKIVPLSMRSGILEWVDNTMPIGEYLAEKGEGGAHARFRPMDATPHKCRAEFKKLASKSNEEKLRIFNKICEGINPVFHKFFETTFPQPTVWYERRRTYIHSVATSSMCGYILGIGDRHVSNILIDKSTAEVVHIDFGIAFEQGRVLPTPETVPFRLTRDIVDGMGVSGVEGVFRKSCEKTVEVLRLHYQTIVTILEVLLYDPLYDWRVSTAEANKRQKDEYDESLFNLTLSGTQESPSKDVNETAERALLRLRAKLRGTETGKSTTVEHQVGTLIQQAVDPANLSKLFVGWQPYL